MKRCCLCIEHKHSVTPMAGWRCSVQGASLKASRRPSTVVNTRPLSMRGLSCCNQRTMRVPSTLPAQPIAEHKFAALDGIRGLLALIVAYSHFPGIISFPGAPRPNAGLCVDFFFLLSGFVIAYTTRKGLPSGSSALNFMIRRLGRLWPLHLSLLALLVLSKLESTLVTWLSDSDKIIPFHETSYEPYKIFTNIFLLQSFDPSGWSWNIPSWSISAEFWVYALLSLLVWKMPKATPIAAILLIITSLSLQIALQGVGGATFLNGVLRCLSGFFLGYLAYRYLPTINIMSKSRGIATTWEGTAILLLVIALSTLTTSLWAIFIPTIFVIPLCIFAYQQGIFSDLLKSQPLQTLGKLSYSIYMVHMPVLEILNHWFTLAQKELMKTYGSRCFISNSTSFPVTPNGCGIADVTVLCGVLFIYFLTVILLSKFTYRYIEAPARQAFSKWVIPHH